MKTPVRKFALRPEQQPDRRSHRGAVPNIGAGRSLCLSPKSLLLILLPRLFDRISCLFGCDFSSGDICAGIVKHPTGVGSKQLIDRYRDPLRILNLLRDRLLERVFDHVGCPFHHWYKQSLLSELVLHLFSQPDLHEIDGFLGRFFCYQPTVQTRKDVVCMTFPTCDFWKEKPP